MLKQGVKTINAKFIWTCALCQLSYSSDLMQPRSWGFFWRVKGIVSNVNYLENQQRNFIQKKYDRKRHLARTQASFSGMWIFFLYGLFTLLMTPKCKKEYISLSPCNLNSFYYFFIFWFKGLSFKTQFRIEFWPPLNGDQLVLT